MFGFLDVPVSGAYHLVTWLASITQPVTGPLAVSVAIIVFTLCVRLLLHPLSRAALRGERARAVMQPELQKLQKKYADNPDRLRQEVAKLQEESGVSLFAGCLPMFAQLPFFWVMYQLFSSATVAGEPNALLAGTLFGSPLGAHWPALSGSPVYFGLAAALAVVAWFSSRWQARQSPDSPKFLRLLPYGTVLAAGFVPLAAGLYLLTTTTWTVAERAWLRRPRGENAALTAVSPRDRTRDA
ncbi:YidC/Oxa1 family membrane protein insertase [Amycolatopsis sp. cg5]|uniref:YidC/Oxa1 family membrane protein insertase n=1 Tax=Amycolatopsis sp. cg5 TaxID=3238802 RepID=UPI00352421D4